MTASTTLGSTTDPLDRSYDLAMLDLDGVVYVGAEAVPGAPSTSRPRRARGDARRVHHQQRLAAARGRWPHHLRELGGSRRARTTW